MPQDKMTEVLYDIELARALSQAKYKDYSSNDAKDALLQGVLAKHQISKEVLDSSLVWYSDNIEVYKKVKDSIASRLSKEQDTYRALLDRENRKNGLSDKLISYYNLTQSSPIYRFNFDSITVKPLMIDTQTCLNFKLLGLSPLVDIKLSLYMQYADTIVISSEYIKTDSVSVALNYIKDRKLKSFSGYLRVDTTVVIPNYNVLIYDINLDKDSVKKIVNQPKDEKTKQIKPTAKDQSLQLMTKE